MYLRRGCLGNGAADVVSGGVVLPFTQLPQRCWWGEAELEDQLDSSAWMREIEKRSNTD